MHRTHLLCLLVVAFSLIACNRTETPDDTVPVAVEVTQTPTVAPTVSIPPSTPTPVPPSPTMTPTSRPATDTPVPTVTPQTYTVVEGDTLLAIALDFGVDVEALAAANGMHTDDFLQIGQEMVIPITDKAAVLPPVDPASEADDEGNQTEALTGSQAATTATEGEAAAIVPPAADPSVSTDPSQTLPAASSTGEETTTTETDASEPVPAEAAPQPAPPPAIPVSNDPPPPTISHPPNINPLTGLPVDDPAKLQRRPLMVRVGNDVGARQSQVGLNSADMVYEEITEWWVTRFTAIYLAENLDTIGPVRSARLINVQLVPQYQGALAHSGGSDPVRWEISQSPITNLDEYYNAAPYFYRPGEGWQTRLAINGIAARNYMTSKGLESTVPLQGFEFGDTIDTGEPGENIYVPYPRATSFTEWHYDAASGRYLRWINGSPLYDANGGQIAAANVIIYFAPHLPTDIVEDTNGATSIRIIMNGKGPAWFFRDGKLNKGFWQTDGTRTPYFAYEDGSSYPLKPGNSWVEVVPTYFKIGLNSADEASSSP
jgi:LysM repeat protein